MILQIHKLAETDSGHCAALLSMIAPKQGAIIVDMGSGYGAVAAGMHELRPDLKFILVNKDGEQLSRSSVGFRVHADMLASGLPDDCCDVVMFNYSIGYIDLDAAFAEASRLLKPRGSVFIWDFTGKSDLMLEKLNYRARTKQDFIDAAGDLELQLFSAPEAYTKDFYAIIPEHEVNMMKEIEKEVKPAAFKFMKVKYGLAFSGGRDSWACLFLSEASLPKIEVFWVNTGKNHPELLQSMKKAREMCSNFTEIKTDQGKQNEENGLPADVVPINWTKLGQEFTGKKDVMVQSYLDCCWENISKPLNDAVLARGVSHLITGQRSSDAHKSKIKNGDEVFGIVRLSPIENWSTLRVTTYLSSRMKLPEHFNLKHSSMDCYDCTAYRAESADRIEFMRGNAKLFEEYEKRNSALNAALKAAGLF